MCLPQGVVLQKPARILRPSRQWDSNLDWNAEDVLQLTLGEEDVQWELKGSDVLSMSIDDIKPTWKVHASSRMNKAFSHYAEAPWSTDPANVSRWYPNTTKGCVVQTDPSQG